MPTEACRDCIDLHVKLKQGYLCTPGRELLVSYRTAGIDALRILLNIEDRFISNFIFVTLLILQFSYQFYQNGIRFRNHTHLSLDYHWSLR